MNIHEQANKYMPEDEQPAWRKEHIDKLHSLWQTSKTAVAPEGEQSRALWVVDEFRKEYPEFEKMDVYFEIRDEILKKKTVTLEDDEEDKHKQSPYAVSKNTIKKADDAWEKEVDAMFPKGHRQRHRMNPRR